MEDEVVVGVFVDADVDEDGVEEERHARHEAEIHPVVCGRHILTSLTPPRTVYSAAPCTRTTLTKYSILLKTSATIRAWTLHHIFIFNNLIILILKIYRYR